jgi:hypothetical protein
MTRQGAELSKEEKKRLKAEKLFFFGVSSAAPSTAISDLRFCNARDYQDNTVSYRRGSFSLPLLLSSHRS